jgi:hypothetical protein
MHNPTINRDKSVFISDLDGTLLSPQATLSDWAVKTLNGFVKEGMAFSVATARTPATVVPLLEKLDLNLPLIVMNGTAFYDLSTQTYQEVAYLPQDLVKLIKDILDRYDKSYFIYCIKDNQLKACYNRLESPEERQFYEERKNRPLKQFVEGNADIVEDVVFFTMLGSKSVIYALRDEIKKLPGLTIHAYRDNYLKEAYFLEIYSHKVSKAQAIQKLLKRYDKDYVVCFGDNLNDLSMFEIAQEAYAVANAHPLLLEKATAVIGSNQEDGVVKYLQKRWQGSV